MHLLDTNVCIALMKGEREARNQIRRIGILELCIPSVVLGELAFGAWRSEFVGKSLAGVTEILRTYQVIPFDEQAALQYGRIRAQMASAGSPIGPNDYLIAATALANDATLVTRNVKEFSRVPGLRWLTA